MFEQSTELVKLFQFHQIVSHEAWQQKSKHKAELLTGFQIFSLLCFAAIEFKAYETLHLITNNKRIAS